MNHVTIEAALKKLENVESPFLNLFSHGSLEVELYKPVGKDLQQPHTRDEVYVISSGSGKFKHKEKEVLVSKGDFLFVPAGDEHRFIEFTEDFTTWVMFYGPEGGE